ncbi:DUF3592 domain-containing protein [Thioalkalicoccus limnaeus]|uniref:DUF3592 domain-containing protein n=1 Tax=Thioalkalicoccus limnaeus TaxID=120681 RepID=UPI003F743C8B
MEVGCLKRPEGYIYVTYYYPLVRYLYEINGKTYEGTQYCIDSKGWWSTDKGFIEKLVNSDRTSVSIYVNPSDPELSVMKKNVSRKRRSHYWGTLLGGVLVSVAAIISAAFVCLD